MVSAFITTAVMQTSGATLYVSQTSTNPTLPYSTWETAAHDIQSAVDAASEGDAVLVAAGTYALTNRVSVTKGIILSSDAGPDQTALDGQWNTRCLEISNVLAVVDGFTMTRGHETDGGDLADGVVMTGGTLTNCVVEKPANPFGVGRLVYCSDGGLITGCTIGPNNAFEANGGGVYLTNSELRDSTISGMLYGPAYGGAERGAGIYAVSSTISGCALTGNYARQAGGGAYLDGCVMDRCVISENRSGVYLITPGQGGGVFATNSVIRDSLVTANVADAGYDSATDTVGGLPGFGGGVFLEDGSLLNCTVTGNRTVPPAGAEASRGGGVYVDNGNGSGNSTVRNSTIYFNSAPSGPNWYWNDPLLPVYQLQLIGEAPFAHNCTTPDPGGIGLGNTVEDPQFVDSTNANYRLAPTSPCIDAGLNEAWMDGAHDLDGNSRIQNGTVDMGAYESAYHPAQRPALLHGRLGLRTFISPRFK